MRSFHIPLLTLLSAAGLCGCEFGVDPPTATPTTGQVDQAIVDGTDTDGDPAVVAIVYSDDASILRCSGTLIADRVVLTSAHCGAQHDLAAFSVRFGSSPDSAEAPVAILAAVAHPDYADTADHDLALYLLAAPSSVAPVTLSTDSALAATPPVSVRLVGYGYSIPDTPATGGRKREGTAQTTEVLPGHVVLGASPSLPCSGDSGGPVFLDSGSGEQLAGVTSRGDAECSSYGRATRVDAHLAAFIQPILDAWAPGTIPDGEVCLYDEHCTEGLCVTAADEPLLRFCSRVCTGDGDCPEPLTCQDDQCRHPLPSPGATGAPCGDHGDCLRGECIAERGLCSLRCVADRGDCPEGFQCQHLGDIDFFCIAEPTEDKGCGCSTGGSHRNLPDAGVLLVLCLALLWMRRAHASRRIRGS